MVLSNSMIRKLIGLFQFGFLDLTVGLFVAHILNAPLWAYPLGAIIAVLPDFDILLALSRNKQLDLAHRNTVFHQPLLFAFIPAIILFFFSPFLALFWLLPLLWHYLHDTVGESMGVQWLYPFSQKKFAFFDYDKTGKRHFFIAHPPTYPGLTLDQAMAKKFFRITPTSVFEAIMPIILLAIILFTL